MQQLAGLGHSSMCHSEKQKRKEPWKAVRVFVLEGDKGLPLNREETGMACRKMTVYKGTRENPALG